MLKTKEQLLLEECIYPYHELFRDKHVAKKLKEYENSILISFVQKLCEQAMADASDGNYSWTDLHHVDYSDDSDQKTGTMHPLRPHGSGTAEVSGIGTPRGGLKIGALRVIIYNKTSNQLDYFFFPKEVWSAHLQKNTSGGDRMLISYSGLKDKYVDWAEQYRLRSFKELSIAK